MKEEKKQRSLRRSFNVNDNLYTPSKLVTPLVEYLHRFSDEFEMNNNRLPVIWCPFDTSDSEFVKVFLDHGYKVVYSHINNGQNFFEYEPDSWDIAISNPPFSQKLAIFERLFKFGKPFAMLCNEMIINYQEVANFFVDHEIQLLCFDKKVSFNGKTSSFASGYFCSSFLPKDLVFYHLKDNNTGSNFIPARMFLIEQGGKVNG